MCLTIDDSTPEPKYDKQGYATAYKVLQRCNGDLKSPIQLYLWQLDDWHEPEPVLPRRRDADRRSGSVYGGVFHLLPTRKDARNFKTRTQSIYKVRFHRDDFVARGHWSYRIRSLAVRRCYLTSERVR